jgi:hypothetical protein
MLDQGKFLPKIETVCLFADVVRPVIDLFKANAENQKVDLVLENEQIQNSKSLADRIRVQ